MSINTNAATKIKGFHFQDVSALYLFLENIKEVDSFSVEGEEDIVLNWNNGTKSFIQSKETIHPYDGFDSSVMKKALKVLLKDLDDYSQDEIKSIVFLTNSHHPFGKEKGNPFDIYPYSFFKYDDLPSEMRNKIDDLENSITQSDVDNSLLRVIKIEYAGSDDRTKLSLLQDSVQQFMNSAQIMNSKYRTLMDSWTSMVSRSAEEEEKVITKDEFAGYTALIYLEDTTVIDGFFNKFSISLRNQAYIRNQYSQYLDSLTKDMHIINRVNSLVLEYNESQSSPKEYADSNIVNFIDSNYLEISDKLGIQTNRSEDEDVAKFIMWLIIVNGANFDNIKEVLK